MKQNFLTIFHSRTKDGGWAPGFEARMFIEPDEARSMNQHFKTSGVKLVKMDQRKDFGPFVIIS